ncbi:MAG: N-acetylmuramoyl-L-alanine amidase [Clostridia bacterium]|nr:N-acetylmuramoyl-L-alanine amidase [Clostridia bacterium]
MMKHPMTFLRSLLCALLCAALVFAAGCSNGDTDAPDAENAGSEAAEALPPEPPGEGVGRIKPVVVPPRPERVCIDPGHGFLDSGAGDPAGGGKFSEGIYEKDIAMATSLLLDEELRARGFQTILTHDGVTMPEGADANGNGIFSAPYERPYYINDYIDPDLLVSVHVNSAEREGACGARIYWWQTSVKANDWSETVSKSIAGAIDANVETTAETLIKNPGNEVGAEYVILGETRCAATLVELGFCTNETDARNMEDPAWQRSMARAIAIGIENFFDGTES